MSFSKIMTSLRKKEYSPVYFFDGDEPFYIDKLTEFIQENVLNEAEREFNQSIYYGRDISPEDLIPVVKRFPMMAEYQVIIVKEAQNWKDLSALQSLLENPVPTTILVITYTGKKLDGRSNFAKLVKKKATYFNSSKLRDTEVASWLNDHCKILKLDIDQRAIVLLSEHIGADLVSLDKALERLKLVADGEKITVDHIQEHIGISKDFNIFELQKAIGNKDYARAIYIANYFANNEKEHHLIPITYGLYRYFTQLIRYHRAENHADNQSLARAMGVNPYFVKDYKNAAINYPRTKLMKVMEILHDIDLKIKGLGNSSARHKELMNEMVARILRA
jgi:DNA polymerase-3 subunit delta